MSNDASLEQLENIYTNRDQQGLIDAINQSQALIEFELDGTILSANENFLATVGYSLEDIVGKHHQIFCDKDYAASPDYKKFWKQLASGKALSGEYHRYAKDGADVWFSASYTPILDTDGKPYKIVEFATDITARKSEATSALRKQTAFENSSAAMMSVDRDFVVMEVNKATEDLLARSAHVFAEIWPGFDTKNIVGTCIDIFHKKPRFCPIHRTCRFAPISPSETSNLR